MMSLKAQMIYSRLFIGYFKTSAINIGFRNVVYRVYRSNVYRVLHIYVGR